MRVPLGWLRGPEYWYDKVDDGAGGSGLAGQDDEFELYKFRLATLNRRWRWVIIVSAINVIFFVLGLVSLGGLYILTKANADNAMRAMSNYSPILEDIELEPQTKRINGTVYPPRKPSFSRAEPNDPSAEAIWDLYTQREYFPASRPDMMKLGAHLEFAVQIPDESFHLGPQSYLASLDSVNKMRCLNLLRKAAFATYPKNLTRTDEPAGGEGKDPGDDMRWLELRRCTDILAQDIMCHADTELVTYRFLDMQREPQPNLSVRRKCRSWEQVLAWQEEHKVDKAKVEEMIVWDGDPRTKLSENEREWYVRNGFEGSKFYPYGNGFDA